MGTANISFGRVGQGGAAGTLPALYSPTITENLTTSAVSATPSVNAAPTEGNAFQMAVRMILNEDGYVAVGKAPVAAIATGMLVKANVEQFFSVHAGDTVSIIDAA